LHAGQDVREAMGRGWDGGGVGGYRSL
jgi:hypothetical protein